MAEHHHRTAEEDAARLAKITIGDDPAHEGAEERRRAVCAIDQRRLRLRERELLRHVVDQHRLQPEVGEFRPRLGKEQDREAGRVAEQALAAPRGHAGGLTHGQLRFFRT